MSAINQALEKHLLSHVYRVIHDQFQEDPSDLCQGVNYEYQGKIWNVRIGFQQGRDEIEAVYLRIHGSDIIYGLYSHENNANNPLRIECIRFLNVTIQPTDTTSKSNHKMEKATRYDFDFMDILTGGVRNNQAEVPKVSDAKLISEAKIFFHENQELVPRIATPVSHYFLQGIVIISALATIYFAYKTLQEAKSCFFKQSQSYKPLIRNTSYTAIAGFICYIANTKKAL